MIVPSYSDFPESNEQEQVIVGACFFLREYQQLKRFTVFYKYQSEVVLMCFCTCASARLNFFFFFLPHAVQHDRHHL